MIMEIFHSFIAVCFFLSMCFLLGAITITILISEKREIQQWKSEEKKIVCGKYFFSGAIRKLEISFTIQGEERC
jgi:hypothetical protein